MSDSRTLAGRRPNIVWFISDDTSMRMLRYGGSRFLSPHIQSLGTEGAVFTRFHCASPICMASRYQYLTGHYGGACPAEDFRDAFPEGEPYSLHFNTDLDPSRERTLAHLLQGAGYRTGFVGKWHAGGTAAEKQVLKHELKVEKGEDAHDAEVGDRLRRQQEFLCELIRRRGFDDAARVIWGNHELLGTDARYHNLEWIAKGALDFIDRASTGDAPFMIHIAPTTMHGPDQAASLMSDPHLTGAGFSDAHLDCMPPRRTVFERIRDAQEVEFNHLTAGALWMDDLVGSVLKRLRDLGLEEDTLVIFSTDHGHVGGKFSIYQEGVGIPFLMRWTNQIRPGTVCDTLTQNVDFLPTVLELAGATPPADMRLDGRSFLPLLMTDGGAAAARDDIFFEFGYTRSVRTERWKYIAWRLPRRLIDELREDKEGSLVTHANRWRNGETVKPSAQTASLARYPHYFDPDQLYDLENDPEEKENLDGDPAHAETLRQMRERLRRYLDSFERPYPDLDRPDSFFATDDYKHRVGEVRAAIEKEGQLWWKRDAAVSGFRGVLGNLHDLGELRDVT